MPKTKEVNDGNGPRFESASSHCSRSASFLRRPDRSPKTRDVGACQLLQVARLEPAIVTQFDSRISALHVTWTIRVSASSHRPLSIFNNDV